MSSLSQGEGFDTQSESDPLRRLELRICRLLRAGVALVALLLAGGWAGMLWEKGQTLGTFSSYRTRPLPQELAQALREGNAAVLAAYAGLALLISLPVLRVLLCAALFLKRRERLMATLAFLVLGALLGSLFLGLEL